MGGALVLTAAAAAVFVLNQISDALCAAGPGDDWDRGLKLIEYAASVAFVGGAAALALGIAGRSAPQRFARLLARLALVGGALFLAGGAFWWTIELAKQRLKI